MVHVSRRAYVSGSAGVALAAVAGCLDSVPVVGGGGLPDYADWLPASVLADGGYAMFVDMAGVRDWPEEYREDFEADEAGGLGVDEEDVDGVLTIGGGMDYSLILFGSFDVDELKETLGLPEESEEELNGFEVFSGMMLQGGIREDAIVIGTSYEAVIEASAGQTERIADVDEQWDDALRTVGGSTVSMVSGMGEDLIAGEASLFSFGIDYAGSDAFDIVGVSHFETAEDAEAAVDDIEADFDEDAAEVESYSIDVDGTAVRIEARVSEFIDL